MNKLSILSKLPEGMTQKVSRAVLVASKNSPRIMFVGGVVGVVGTVVLASRATLKVSDRLDDINNDLGNIKLLESDHGQESSVSKRQKAFVLSRGALDIAKLYTPATICGVASIGLLTGSHVTLTKRNAGLGAALVATEKAFDQYRARVAEELGEDKDREFRHGVDEHKEVVVKDGGKQKTITHKRAGAPSLYAREYSEFTARNWQPFAQENWFYIQCQQRTANDMLRINGHLFLNEVYDLLGLERSTAGAVVGWVVDDGDGYVDFGIEENEDFRDFMVGRKNGILLDFNVQGEIFRLLDAQKEKK